MSDRAKPIVVERQFSFPGEVVWEAITRHDQMVQWFFDEIPDFKPEVGFKTEFVIDTGERKFNHLWTIKEVMPGNRIVYDWRYEGYSGIGTVAFDLIEEAEGCRLRITNEGLDTFPDELPEFTVEACHGGWTWMLGSLNSFLSGAPAPE
ncbi:MAG: SRPBCC domain-containing protein [Planctomycetota bacterium]